MAIIENEVTVYIEDELIRYIDNCIENNSKEQCTENVLEKAEELGLTEEEALALLDHYWKMRNDVEYFMLSNSTSTTIRRMAYGYLPSNKEDLIKFIKYYSLVQEWGFPIDNTIHKKALDKEVEKAMKKGTFNPNDPDVQAAFSTIKRIEQIKKEKFEAEQKIKRARRKKGCWFIIIWLILAYLLAFAMI